MQEVSYSLGEAPISVVQEYLEQRPESIQHVMLFNGTADLSGRADSF